MRSQQVRLGSVGIILVLILGVAGCGSSKDFTPEDFKTIKEEMPEAKVIEVLGKPKETLEAMGTRRLFWETKGKYYSVSFKDGKVAEPAAHESKEEYELMKGLMKAAKEMQK